MSHDLKEGTKVHCIWWTEGSLTVGAGVGSMVISEQIGQMSMVPWVLVKSEGMADQLYNCALLEGLELVRDHERRGS